MKTFMAKAEEIERKWYIVDASDMILGRLATMVTDLLSGKNKVTYTPHVDCGDFVIVINSDKIALTGKKLEQKKLIWHSGFIGGLKEIQYKTLMQNNSPKALEQAVKGMLRKNKLRKKQLTRLKIFKDANHSHEAQKPKTIIVKGAKVNGR